MLKGLIPSAITTLTGCGVISRKKGALCGAPTIENKEMRMKQFALALLGLIIGFSAQAHDYHASITDVEYNPKTQNLEVALRVFTDDLENALSQRAKGKVSYSSQSEKVKQYLSDYLNAKLSFELVDGKPLKQRVIGSEEETDAVWIYIEVPVQKAALSQLYVKNAVFTELFNDQMNVVNINYKGKTSSVLLQKYEVEKKVTL